MTKFKWPPRTPTHARPAFTDQPSVANGASDLLRRVFGEAGVHARAAVGVAQLPFGACVEIDLIAELSGECGVDR